MVVQKPKRQLTSAWEEVSPSLKLAFRNYEQIGWLFFIPTLFLVLGYFYFGDPFVKNNHFVHHIYLSGRQQTGAILIGVWLVLSIINYVPSIYFRLCAVRNKTAPSISECYRRGLKLFGRVWLSEIATLAMVVVGVVAIILPGVILFRRYILTPYYAADNPNLSLGEVFRRSAKQTRQFSGYIYSTFVLIIVFDLIVALIFDEFTLGEIAVYLITYSVLFMPALRYTEIAKHTQTRRKKPA